jgi:diketogulonate reductase-like aldo/keto reductase
MSHSESHCLGDRVSRRAVIAAGLAGAVLPAGLLAASAEQPRSRMIPSSGEPLPVVGLGTARTFDVDAADAQRMARLGEVLTTLLDGNARLVDTSPMYGNAEQIVGQLAGGMDSERMFVATKVWTRGRQEGIEQMRRSQQLLGAQRIDLMQIHNLLDWRTHLDTLRAQQQEGEFRYIGISHYLVDAFADVAEVLRTEPLDFLQINHSLMTPDAERTLLPLAADRGVAVIVNRPFENGALFARVRGHEVPPWAREAGMPTWGQYFLKFILAQPAVTCVIPATRNPDNLRDNLQAAFGELPDEPLRRRMREHVMSL